MCEIFHTALKFSRSSQNASQADPFLLHKKSHLRGSVMESSHSALRLPPPAREIPQKSSAALRKKLWDLDCCYHCSVIGTCLTLSDLRQIQRRLRVRSAIYPLESDYELHRMFVAAAQDGSPASRLIHKFLDRKHKSAIQHLTKAHSDQEINVYWDMAVAAGEIAGAYWALITRSDTPKALLDRVYGEVHMLSHLSGASIRIDMQDFNRLKRCCPELEAQLAETQAAMRRRLAEQQDVISALNKRLAQSLEAERKFQAAEARLAAFEERMPATHFKTEVANLTLQLLAERARANQAEATAHLWQQQTARAVERNEWLTQQLTEIRHERDRLETTLGQLLEPQQNIGTYEEFASSIGPNLIGRCILYVGGRQSQCVHFRELVERCNGRFIHHDGGREDARAQLWDVVQQADAVLCPLDCISHDAMHRVKRFCERTTKPLVLLPRASLAAFNRGLNTVASSRLPSC